MSSSPTSVMITVDGSVLRNGRVDSVGGWGAVITLPYAQAELYAPLCKICDGVRHTNIRAELRAVKWAFAFAHELAKLGHPLGRCMNQDPVNEDVMNDARPVSGDTIKLVVRTDSEYVVRGWSGRNVRRSHLDLWEKIDCIAACMRNNGVDLKVRHVRGHAGDWANERADQLARTAALEKDWDEECDIMNAKCQTCDVDFGNDYVALASHLKEMHMERDVGEETAALLEDILIRLDNGLWACGLCEKVCRSRFALKQHVEAKHC